MSYAVLTNRQRTLGPASRALREDVRFVARSGAERADAALRRIRPPS